MNTKEMVEAFQCPGCVHGENPSCGMFKLHEVATGTSNDDGSRLVGGFRCRNQVSTANLGGYVNIGLPVPFARVQYREGREEVKTNIRLHLYAVDYGTYWDGFNVPVWALEKSGFLFVRTYCPRTDQSYVDVIHGGTIDLIRSRYDGCIDITPIADKMVL